VSTAADNPTEATTAIALSYLPQRLHHDYPDLARGVVIQVVRAARGSVGTSSPGRPVRDVVAEIEASARAALDRLRDAG
jgi:hypothetical protein